MITLRRLRRRIRSINSTRQITRAMQMVAASRLKKSTAQLLSYRLYADKMRDIFERLGNLTRPSKHRLLEKREIRRILVMVVTSSRGLCGAYNTTLIKIADSFLNKFNKNNLIIMPIGKKGYRHYQKLNFNLSDPFLDFDIKLNKEQIKEIYEKAEKYFVSQRVDEVYIIYPRFISRLKYEPTIEKLLNLEAKAKDNPVEYIIEPKAEDFLKAFLPAYLVSKLTLYLFESLAAEYSARTMAMKIATDNANSLLDELTLQRNKIRQAGITKEILEIITTAEALK